MFEECLSFWCVKKGNSNFFTYKKPAIAGYFISSGFIPFITIKAAMTQRPVIE